MQELIGQELIQVEIVRHEEVKTAPFIQTRGLSPHHPYGCEYQDVDEKQISRYDRYISKHNLLQTIIGGYVAANGFDVPVTVFGCKITKNIRFWT